MKAKILAIVIMLVVFVANASAQSVVYSFDFNEIGTDGGKESIGFSKLRIYDNGTAHFEGHSFGGAKFNTTISIKKIEVSDDGSFVLYSANGNNYKKPPFILIGGLIFGSNLNAEVGAGGVSYLYISENEVYVLSNFEFESNREKNKKQLDRMLYDYRTRRGIFRNCDGSSTPSTTKPKSDQKTVASGVTPQEAYNKGKAYFMSHNYSDALTWAKIAADGEYCPAYVMMAEIYESYGSPVDDPSTARYYYSLAVGCASKNTRDYWFSCWRLGDFYERGKGNVTKDLNKALYYYQQARAYTISSNYPLFDSEVARVKRMLGY